MTARVLAGFPDGHHPVCASWALAGQTDEVRMCGCAGDLRDAVASALVDLAEWHETKAEKARRFPGPLERNEDVMKGKATVHDDAARRLRELAELNEERDQMEGCPDCGKDSVVFTDDSEECSDPACGWRP